ncbi:ABC transporter substrate-binding protein [Desulfopila sp. IMCC35008]|uniref:ABC transporter substrate-binding protein n=1 Tax=Desulfopila sp. IMCC35008 TaxID=2653858 RepID=UPI0013D2D22E|nr:ABC transporter substrate-binding protein [Desulfopila sp. IMCC35008]
MIRYRGNTFLFLLLTLLVTVLLCGCEKKEPHYTVGVIQWTEQIQPFIQSYRGILDSLNDKGFLEGVNLTIDYVNVEQDNAKALISAKRFIDNGVDLIVTLGTGSTLEALQASQGKPTPLVYSIVGAPEATGIIRGPKNSGPNITGVSMKIPMGEQFKLIQEILPQTNRLGILFCKETPQAVATGHEATDTAIDIGWQQQTMSLSSSELTQLQDKVRQLAEDVDAIYLPTDPILGTPDNIQTIIRTADQLGVPVIGVARNFVEAGALAALHCDFYELGRQTSELVVKVLMGIDIQTIPPQKPMTKRVSINLDKARKLNIEINRNVILKADYIFDDFTPPAGSNTSP